MTEKKQKILETALILFTEKGYSASSTAEIAKLAGVSEGLIFRHFNNKKGLLEALLRHGAESLNRRYQALLDPTLAPREALRRILSLPFQPEQNADAFWRLHLSLKWHLNETRPSPTEPLRSRLEHIFTVLGSSTPATEARLVLMILDGVALASFTEHSPPGNTLLHCLLEKYDLE